LGKSTRRSVKNKEGGLGGKKVSPAKKKNMRKKKSRKGKNRGKRPKGWGGWRKSPKFLKDQGGRGDLPE